MTTFTRKRDGSVRRSIADWLYDFPIWLGGYYFGSRFDGGPPHSRLDLGCLKYDPANQSAWFEDGGSAGPIDEGFGYTADLGPCTSSNFGFRKRFQEASIAYGDWQYNYPRTMVWFLLGAQDNTASVGQYAFFHQRLLAENSPFFRF